MLSVEVPTEWGVKTMAQSGQDRTRKQLLEWALRSEWDDLREEVFEEHLGRTLEAFDLAPEEAGDLIGPDRFAALVGWTMEALVATPLDDSGRTIIDTYLERRGRRETEPGRRYLHALRSARASLFRVLEVSPGRHLVVQDRLRESVPVTVRTRTATDGASPGDHMALRLIDLGGEIRLAGAGLWLAPDTIEILIVMLTAGPDADPANVAAALALKGLEETPENVDWLHRIAADPSPALAGASLGGLIVDETDVEPVGGDTPALYRVAFPVVGDLDELRARLNEDDRFRPDDDESTRELWEVCGLLPEMDDDEGTEIEGSLSRVIEMELVDGHLHLIAGVPESRDEAASVVAAVCDGLLGPPVESVVTIDELRLLFEATREEP